MKCKAVKSLLLYITLLVLAACLISCQKDEESFKSIYSNNNIDKMVIRNTNNHFKEITDIERIIKWADNVHEWRFMRDGKQEE